MSAGSEWVSPPGQPYNWDELMQLYDGRSPSEVYVSLSKARRRKPLSSLVSIFPQRCNQGATMTSLDITRTYAGPRGVELIVEICKLLPRLQTLILRDNQLDNKVTWHVTQMAKYHPSLCTLDLSCNPISWTAGMCLLDLVQKNHQMKVVELRDTLVEEKLRNAIAAQVHCNASPKGGRVEQHPTGHSIALRLRALKQFFQQQLRESHREAEGLLPRSTIIRGRRELTILAGEEESFTQKCTEEYVAAQLQRSSAEDVNWDAFLILVMLDDVTYSPSLVRRIREAFRKYDSEGRGFLESRFFANAIEAIYKFTPTKSELEGLRAFFEMEEETTLRGDEFLLLAYAHCPTLGQRITMTTRTPLNLPPLLNHF